MKKRKKIVLTIVTFFFITYSYAQVTIGSGKEPEHAALLELKSHEAVNLGGATTDGKGGGLLFSRVSLTDRSSLSPFFTSLEDDYADQKKKHIGLIIYNVHDATHNSIKEGLYIWDGEMWLEIVVRGDRDRTRFFYMPTFPVNVARPAEVDLYHEFENQFSNPVAWSDDNAKKITVPYSRDDLYYYVTSCDETLFNTIEITEGGNMSYTIKSTATLTDYSFINIVFVVKTQ